MSINKVMLTGNLTRDPELKSTSTGTALLRIGIAVNDRRYNAKEDKFEDLPNFIECVMFGKRGESLEKYLKKGAKVAIEGKLRWSSCCLLYTSPSPRDGATSRMPSSA